MEATFENAPLDRLAGQPGHAGGYDLQRFGDGRPGSLAFWTTAPAGSDAYLLDADEAGTAAGRPAGAMSIGYFDGPISAARLAATRYAGQARIVPALRHVPGLVRTMLLWQPVAAALCVVTVTVDLAALEAVGRTVNGTALLPDEDPALLSGLDRFEIHRVLTATRTRHLTEGASA